MSDLPSICEIHPDAKIRHDWVESYYVLNNFPSGTADKTANHYYCAECGCELCSPEEYYKRINKTCTNLAEV
jgi:hypothetical protein